MRQTWRHLTFLHWPYKPSIVRPLVPQQLEIDMHDATAWIGLVPFLITGLTLPRAPAVPWLSSFPETNVRTYVIDQHGRRGVWFFSLDAARSLAVYGARLAYGLPYFRASMSVTCRAGEVRYSSRRLERPPTESEVRYSSRRLERPPTESDIRIRIGSPLPEPSELEVFLTARFCLFANRRGRLVRADIEHPPWPLRRAHAVAIRETLIKAAGLPPPGGDPVSHFASRLDVLVAKPRPVT